LPLLQVCQSWKKVAMSIQRIWTAIHISPHHIRDIRTLRAWLKLSGSHPLSIYLHANCDQTLADEALDVLLLSMNRWQHVSLHWYNEHSIPVLSARCVDKADANAEPRIWVPLLETFQLHTALGGYDIDDQLAADLTIIMHNAPKLRTFRWTTQSQDPPMASYDIRLAGTQLSKLELGSFLSLQNCIDILSQCPLIEVCNFPLVRLHCNVHPLISPTTLRHLHTLYIDSFINMSNFFSSFILPALRNIRVDSIPNESEYEEDIDLPEWSQATFISLLRRSSCAPNFLSLGVAMSKADLIECLQSVNGSIKSLTVRRVSDVPFVTDRTLNLLTHHVLETGEISCLCPNLCLIDLHDCLISPLPEGALADMIESRWSISSDVLSHRHACSDSRMVVRLWVRLGVVPVVDARRLKVMMKKGLHLSIY
jgi:hypothetical protein